MTSSTMKRIDGHIHIGQWREAAFLNRRTTVPEALAVLDETGLEGALATPTDRGDNEALLQQIGESGRGRLMFACWVDPQDAELSRFMRDQRRDIAALKIHPTFVGTPVVAAAFEPALAFAHSEAIPVVVHCGRYQELASFRYVLQVAERMPAVNFVLSHMGGDSPQLIRDAVEAIVANGLTNVYLGTESIREYWMIRHALDRLGPCRLIFGSDYNLGHPAAYLALIRTVTRETAVLQAILCDNLLSIIPADRVPARLR